MNSKGLLAERKAANYLMKKHYTLLETNYSSRFGEIDLIMQKKNIVAFIEVKQRDINSIAAPKEFVDKYKRQRIIKTASLYLASHHTDLQPRFDVVEVITKNSEIKSIKHLENAFTLD